MIRKSIFAALLCSSAFAVTGTAFAQDVPAAQSAEPTEPDLSDATADAAIAAAAPVNDAQAKIELLTAQVEALQESLAQVQATIVKTTPSWKGGPQFDDKDAGFSFKPKGCMQFDAGYVGFPNGDELRGTQGGSTMAISASIPAPAALVFGAEGSLPGGFKYKAEFNFAKGRSITKTSFSATTSRVSR